MIADLSLLQPDFWPSNHLLSLEKMTFLPEMRFPINIYLLIAVKSNRKFIFTDAVRFLLENGCQPTVRNTTGATPLHYSVAEGYISITKILLDNGAFVNALVTTNEVSVLGKITSLLVVF